MSGNFLNQILPTLQIGLQVFLELYFVWVPIVLWIIFWNFWKKYVVSDALLNEETTLLQIKLPAEVTKSPRAMELFFQNLHQTGGEGNFYDKYWKGGTRPWFSLELVSIEGEIRFYIWTRKKFANLLETQLYAQYPSLEVVKDAPDYTKKVKYNPEKINVFGSMFKFTKDDYYPIKTYVDYELDKDPKEEFKIDPIGATLEFLGSIGSREQIWLQILVRAHKQFEEKSFWEGFFKKLKKTIFPEKIKRKNFKESGKKAVDELLERDEEVKKDDPQPKKPNLSKEDEKIVEIIQRGISKPGFDVAIRGIYLAEKDNFESSRIGGLLGAFKPYNSDGLNGFKPSGATKFDFPWQDRGGKKLSEKKEKILKAYVTRSHFATRHNTEDMILNTEELATIFHFPGADVEVPTLPRITSKKAGPPTNIPT